jgi:hypothetical protein
MAEPGDGPRRLQAIREAVSSYDHDGPEQWYVDDLVIDCDADTFWRVVEQALAEAAARVVKSVRLPPRLPGQERVVLTCSCGGATDLTYQIILAPAAFTCHGCRAEHEWPPRDGPVPEEAP